jgi:predicted nucleic acid-binding Zn ribbon protein
MSAPPDPRRVGDFLQGILRSANPRRRGGLYELTEAWSRAAGPEVARRSRIVELKRDVLTVSVESAALRQELETFRKEEILRRLNAEFTKRIASLRCILA